MKPLTSDLKNVDSLSALARSLGISVQRIVNWRNRGRIPADMVISYCRARTWQITPHQLRPDIYPSPSDGLPASKRDGKAA